MSEEIVRMKKEDYDELIGLMDYTFGTKYKRRMSFEEELPKMCRRTDERMGRHLGLRVDGKLVAALSEHLKANGIKGVMLTTGTGNVKANGFYKKYNFEKCDMQTIYVHVTP